MSTEPKVSIVIPVKDDEERLLRLVKSLYQSQYSNFEILIVNDSVNKLHKEKFSFSNLSFFENGSTHGLAYAQNVGAKQATGDYVLFIDADNVIDKAMIGHLVESFKQHGDILAVGPLTYYFDQPDKIWFLSCKINWLTSHFKFNNILPRGNKPLVETANLHNCLMVQREKGQAVGWFDEKMFLFGTEFDFLLRLKKRFGGMIVTCLRAVTYHDIAQSKDDLIRSLSLKRDETNRVYYLQRNRGVLTYRYGGWLDRLSLALIFYPLFTLAYSCIFLLFMNFKLLIWNLKGVLAGYKHLFVKL